ncbi:hypothetical protein BDW02DRAFT_16558 [Decorospora gaudefroyi]|uniref:C2H2-type domain-containing protein n=1 Tax=Decorospora gaudefroyi TaxID=184978 RepID=A0A6A5KQJ7_9PLEO|nr:hypothetical protein BDW02DRAFT_16558 [Decorospora gaudefroyi]
MAASTRAITPTPTGPFTAPNGPSTPGSTARNSHGGATFGTHLTKSPRGLSPRLSPQPLTGAAALADERRFKEQAARQTSPNPAVAALQSLNGNPQSVSRPSDAPQATAQTDATKADKMAKPLLIPDHSGVTGDSMQTSPVSLSSFGDGDAPPALVASTAEGATHTSGSTGREGAPHQPLPPQQHHQHHHQLIAPNPGDNPGNRAFTFPGPLPPEPDPRAPARQMSLPGYGQNTPKSPSTKRHKCPYCSTDFTRHHNLKSHLLTHSQEKPYECPTCQARFRRLHDLKRHTKLHTGERPHTCYKCGRRFARGDALARHNKGQGGCAGRRSSFGMDDDLADGKGDDMDGVVYTGEPDGEGDEDDDGSRRVSEPARKRQNTGNSTQGSYHQHSSTYPPIAANRSPSSQNNIRPYHPASSTQPTNVSPKAAPSSISSIHNANTHSNVFAQGGMTESPRPLSPGLQEQHRLGAPESSLPGSRSPSLSHHLHQNFARGRGTPPVGLALASANNGPHLPSLPGLNPMPPKQGSQGGKGNGPSMLQHQTMAAPGSSSQPGSTSSHGGSGNSMREVMGGQVDVWQYVREIESRMARMEKEHNEKLSTLQNEITTLRAQLAQQHVNNAQTQQQGH